jgi:hypothetical protein
MKILKKKKKEENKKDVWLSHPCTSAAGVARASTFVALSGSRSHSKQKGGSPSHQPCAGHLHRRLRVAM